MDLKLQPVFTDEMLSFLYSSTVFQSLNEEEQQLFIKKYESNHHFHEILSVAQIIQEVIVEVEQSIPPISEEVREFFSKPNKSILDCVRIEDNILHVPFDQLRKENGPLIVCLQQGDDMKEVEQFCKGMILPLLDLCHRQHRDLMILPFAEQASLIQLKCGKITFEQFDTFIHMHLEGVSKLNAVYHVLSECISSLQTTEQVEVIIVSNNHFCDYNENIMEQFDLFFKAQNIAISAIAMSEETFNRQPLSFIDKVFFANE